MRLLHGNEMHFVRCPDGRIYSTGVAVYAWWTDYLKVFDEVRVLSRVKTVTEMLPADRIAEGRGVSFEPLPDFRGPEDYLRNSHAVHRTLKHAIEEADAYLFRVPGTVGYLAAKELVKQGKPYGLEVVGDPYDVFVAGSVRHPLRAFFRQWHTRNLRTFCDAAAATMYVTEYALQHRYPPRTGAFSTHYSDVKLFDDVFVLEPRIYTHHAGPFRLIFVGTLEQLYKAPDVLIDAVYLCRQRGLDVTLTFAGDGACRAALEAQAAKLDLLDHVSFAGHVSDRERLIEMLDEADAFVLPSRAEGLPRAMLEAMARALPCIGSSVDGIPELLAAEDLVPPGNAQVLAERIAEVAVNAERRNLMSVRNLAKAAEYRREIMIERKLAFCRYLRHASANESGMRVALKAETV